MKRTALALVLGGTLLVTGCGSSAVQGEDDAMVRAGADELVLSVRHVGGFLPPTDVAARVPLVSIYGDGRVITQGPQIAIYPAPALPNLQVAQLTEAELAELVEKAKAAGVEKEQGYGQPPIADAPTTVFTLHEGDATHTAEVYALQEAGGPGGEQLGVTKTEAEARAGLRGLYEELTGIGGTETGSYEPTVLAVVATPYPKGAESGSPELEQTPKEWPGQALPGEVYEERLELHCSTVSGDELTDVMEAARDANALTPWVSGGETWSVTFRPLLPHEESCDDLRNG